MLAIVFPIVEPRVIDELIKRDPRCVHFRGFQQETPLHDACGAGCVKVARRLIEKGAEIAAVYVCARNYMYYYKSIA